MKKMSRRSKRRNPISATEVYKAWHTREPSGTQEADVPWPESMKEVEVLGRIVQMDYNSDKWNNPGREESYYHPVEKNHPLLGRFKSGSEWHYVVMGVQEASPRGLIETEDASRAMTGKLPPRPKEVALLGRMTSIVYLDEIGDIQSITFKDHVICASENGLWNYIIKVEGN
jgi:hypothetical protein